MGTPFTTSESTDPAIVPATDAQIERALVPMLFDRHWQTSEAPPKYVGRIAVLSLVMGWAIGSVEVPELAAEVMTAGSIGERINQLMAHLLTTNSIEEGSEYLWAPLTKDGARKLIEWLSSRPFKSQAREIENALDRHAAIEQIADAAKGEVHSYRDAEVPAGRYAIETGEGATNALAFYKVDRPTEGKWAGRVFVKLMLSDEERRLSQKQGHAIIDRIAEVGAEAATARYGHEIGECGMCGRTLTNDDSRERGIGPICAAKAGW